MAKKKKYPSSDKRTGAKQSLIRHLPRILAGAIILMALVAAAGLVALFLFSPDQPGPEEKPPAIGKHSQRPLFEIYPKEKKDIPPPVAEPAATPPRIAIIIDDLGYDRHIARQFLELDAPLTFAILPFSPQNKRIAAAAHGRGREIMLHLPMEPLEYPHINPGAGVLLTSMSPDQLIGQLKKNLADVPHIAGVNNHMGSRLTADSSRLYQIFSILKKEHLFFIDSQTTGSSLCRSAARLLQVPFARRDVFLDNSLSETYIRRQVNILLRTAEHRGCAIGIGHPHEETCRVLQEMLPRINQRARLVPASQLVHLVDS